MRKYIKLFSVLFLSLILTSGFVSCSDDDDYIDGYMVSMVTLDKIGEDRYDLILDNGDKLWVADPEGVKLRPDYERGIIYYNILSPGKEGYDYNIKLYSFYDLLTKPVIYIAPDDQIKQDSIGNTPIRVDRMWERGGYLNVAFTYTTEGGHSHMLNLVSAEEDLGKDDEVVKLAFRHNAYKDKGGYPVGGYVSFGLAPYLASGSEEVTFEITWQDFDNVTKTKKIEYKYDGQSTQQSSGAVDENYNNTNLNIY